MSNHHESGMSRRNLLRTGGISLSLAAIVAACSSESAAPGRVGNAPVATALPEEDVDDAVYLRTATSLHLTVNELYRSLLERNELDADGVTLLERIIADHEETVAELVELTTANGGEPYECTNTWIEQRVLPSLIERIDGNEDADIAPSDDVARDILELANAFESMVAATHQQLIEVMSTPELRREMIGMGALAARHAAAVAIFRTGAPDGYVSPVVLNDDVEVAAEEIPPLFAVPGRFGSLAPVPLFIGGLTVAGGRFETSIETPAENSFIYASMSCDA